MPFINNNFHVIYCSNCCYSDWAWCMIMIYFLAMDLTPCFFFFFFLHRIFCFSFVCIPCQILPLFCMLCNISINDSSSIMQIYTKPFSNSTLQGEDFFILEFLLWLLNPRWLLKSNSHDTKMYFALTWIDCMSLVDVLCFRGWHAAVRADDSGFLARFNILSFLDGLHVGAADSV